MAYLSLSKAAKYINDRIDGAAIDAEDLLRYGSQGHIVITASFSGEMYNPMTQANEDYFGLLVIPPRHLLEMDIEERTRIQVAHSLDGRVMYFPQAERTRDQLSITISALDELIRRITNAKERETSINKIRKNSLDEPKQTDSISQKIPEGSMKPANNWGEHGLQRLLSESREAGMTQKILADRYGVSRQRIGMLLKNARPKKRNAFSGFADSNSKK